MLPTKKSLRSDYDYNNEASLYSNFIDSLRSQRTKDTYNYILKRFMAFHHMEKGKYSLMMLKDTQTKEELIKSYILHLVGKNISTSQINMTICTLRNFYEMNSVEDINWRKLKRFTGEQTPFNDGRCYEHAEIHSMVTNAKQKLKCAILLMASAGLRIGALESILVNHLQRRDDLYKISVYKGLKGKGSYYTFCTPEAATAIDDMLEFRRRCGEKIDENSSSPLFRRDFDTDFLEQARKNVKPWSYEAIHGALYHLLVSTGLTSVNHTAYKRKDVKMSHGLRSFFVKQLVNAKIHDIVIKKLTGHAPGRDMTQLYSKQTEHELLSEYRKAIPLLTINPENRLKTELKETQDKQDELALMRLKHDKEIEAMRNDQKSLIQTLINEGVLKPTTAKK